MQLVQQQIDGEYILISKDVLSNVKIEHFNCEYLAKNHQLEPFSKGRGKAWRFILGDSSYVLRHYCRGGLLAKLIRDRYLWLGLSSSRVWREIHLLAQLYEEGFPVPKPIAGRVKKSGLVYKGDLITQQIPSVEPLSQFLVTSALPASKWRDIGRIIQQFHHRGVFHADLNAHNILLGNKGFYIIDFDKCKIKKPNDCWQQANLQRLLRSFNKLKAQNASFGFEQRDWLQLIRGYSNE